jgi:hypothetical protein
MIFYRVIISPALEQGLAQMSGLGVTNDVRHERQEALVPLALYQSENGGLDAFGITQSVTPE